MSFEKIFTISGSGLKSQMLRIEVLSANLANANVTRTPEGGPYRRKDVVFQSREIEHNDFNKVLLQASKSPGVEVVKVVEDQSPFLKKFDPQHPDAGADGYVLYPNVNIVAEMVNLQEASRSYEANISVILAVKNMAAKTFEIGR